MSNFYEENHRQYFDSTVSIDPSAFLEPLAERLAPKATILDVGCGSGRDLRWLKERAYKATGLELSPSLADLARRHSGCPVTGGDFRTYDFSRVRVDAVLLIGALVHLEHQQLPDILKRICCAVVAGGIVYLSLKEGKGTKTGKDGRVFYLWDRLELETILTASGLSVVYFSRTVSKQRSSDTWLSFILHTKKDFDADSCP